MTNQNQPSEVKEGRKAFSDAQMLMALAKFRPKKFRPNEAFWSALEAALEAPKDDTHD